MLRWSYLLFAASIKVQVAPTEQAAIIHLYFYKQDTPMEHIQKQACPISLSRSFVLPFLIHGHTYRQIASRFMDLKMPHIYGMMTSGLSYSNDIRIKINLYLKIFINQYGFTVSYVFTYILPHTRYICYSTTFHDERSN